MRCITTNICVYLVFCAIVAGWLGGLARKTIVQRGNCGSLVEPDAPRRFPQLKSLIYGLIRDKPFSK